MTETIIEIKSRFLALGRDILSQDVEARDARGGIESDWRPLWDAAAEAGVLRLVLPAEYGGDGHKLLEAVRILHALGEGCRDNGLLLALNGQIWAMQMSILEFGSDAQKMRWLPLLAQGSLVCAHAVTEVESGSDAGTIQTRAERIDGGYLLNGEKVWIGMAPAADVAQVFAVTDPDKGQWGISAFLVDMNTSGIRRSAAYDKAGHRTVPAGSITFDNVEIPADALLGQEGAGHAIFNRSIDWERRFIFTSHIGAMNRQIKNALSFAKSRAPGGTPIVSHQSVSNRLAEMQLRYECARLMVENAAREIDTGTENRMTAPMVKIQTAEALLANALDAQRLYASSGYLRGESDRMLRDMSGAITLGGTSDIQRLLISALMRSGT